MDDASTKRTSRDDIADLIKARYVLLYVVSHEEERALTMLRKIVDHHERNENHSFYYSVHFLL